MTIHRDDPNSPGYRRHHPIFDDASVKKLTDELEKFKWPDNGTGALDMDTLRAGRQYAEKHDHAVDALRYAMFVFEVERHMSRWEKIKMFFRHRYYRIKAWYLRKRRSLRAWLCARDFHSFEYVVGVDFGSGVDTSVEGKRCRHCNQYVVVKITEYVCPHGFVSHCPFCK